MDTVEAALDPIVINNSSLDEWKRHVKGCVDVSGDIEEHRESSIKEYVKTNTRRVLMGLRVGSRDAAYVIQSKHEYQNEVKRKSVCGNFLRPRDAYTVRSVVGQVQLQGQKMDHVIMCDDYQYLMSPHVVATLAILDTKEPAGSPLSTRRRFDDPFITQSKEHQFGLAVMREDD